MARKIAQIGVNYTPPKEKSNFSLKGGQSEYVILAQPYMPVTTDGKDATIDDNGDSPDRAWGGVIFYLQHDITKYAVTREGKPYDPKTGQYASLTCVAGETDVDGNEYPKSECLGCALDTPVQARFGLIVFVLDKEAGEWKEMYWLFSQDVKNKLDTLLNAKFNGKWIKTAGLPLIVKRLDGQFGKYLVDLVKGNAFVKPELPVYSDPEWRPNLSIDKNIQHTPKEVVKWASNFGVVPPNALKHYLTDQDETATEPKVESTESYDFDS